MKTKLLYLVLLGITTLVAVSCDDTSKPPSDNIEKLSDATYRGIIPCADCAGILYEVSLNKDQSYSASSTYIGESNRPFAEHGSWEIKHDTLLVLQDGSKRERALAIGDSTLTMLDADHEYVTGSLADHFVLSKKSIKGDLSQAEWVDIRKEGIDFRASGREPSWSLKIDFDKAITLSLGNRDSRKAPVPRMKEDTASKARIFAAKTAEGKSLTVNLYPTGCIDHKTSKVFTHGVVVKTGDKSYRGCGNIINEPYRLHDFWTLYSFQGTEVKSDTLRKMPAINFDITQQQVSGNSGCNMFSGGISLQGDSLSINKLASTKMACQESMDFENKFLKSLSNIDIYEIEDGELTLFKNGEPQMVFMRAK